MSRQKPVRIGDVIKSIDEAVLEIRESVHEYEIGAGTMHGKRLELVRQRMNKAVRELKARANVLEATYHEMYANRAALDRAELEAETEESPDAN